MPTRQELIDQANVIRNETVPEANTATRVGDMLNNIIKFIPDSEIKHTTIKDADSLNTGYDDGIYMVHASNITGYVTGLLLVCWNYNKTNIITQKLWSVISPVYINSDTPETYNGTKIYSYERSNGGVNSQFSDWKLIEEGIEKLQWSGKTVGAVNVNQASNNSKGEVVLATYSESKQYFVLEVNTGAVPPPGIEYFANWTSRKEYQEGTYPARGQLNPPTAGFKDDVLYMGKNGKALIKSPDEDRLIPLSISSSGTSSQRPVLSEFDKGYIYSDTTLNKLIVWNGKLWMDSDGRELDVIDSDLMNVEVKRLAADTSKLTRGTYIKVNHYVDNGYVFFCRKKKTKGIVNTDYPNPEYPGEFIKVPKRAEVRYVPLGLRYGCLNLTNEPSNEKRIDYNGLFIKINPEDVGQWIKVPDTLLDSLLVRIEYTDSTWYRYNGNSFEIDKVTGRHLGAPYISLQPCGFRYMQIEDMYINGEGEDRRILNQGRLARCLLVFGWIPNSGEVEFLITPS